MAAGESEELRLARIQIRTLRSELADAVGRTELARLRYEAERDHAERLAYQIDAIRRTKSWKVTRLLRALRRLRRSR